MTMAPSGYLAPRSTVLWPLPTREARKGCLCRTGNTAAPGRYPVKFKGEGLEQVSQASSTGKTRAEAPWGRPLASSLLCMGTRASHSGPLSGHHRSQGAGGRMHSQLSREMDKTGVSSRPNFLTSAVRCMLGKGELFLQLSALSSHSGTASLHNVDVLVARTGRGLREVLQLLGDQAELRLAFNP